MRQLISTAPLIVFIALLAALLAGCGTEEAPSTGPVLLAENTIAPSATPSPTIPAQSATPSPTRTPTPTRIPPTITLTPTRLPTLATGPIVGYASRPTATLLPTFTPWPSSTPTATRTVTPLPSPTATITLTITPTLRATATGLPTTTPQPSSTFVPVQATACPFGWFFASAPVTCPASPATTSAAAYQPFERGWMIWLGEEQAIVVIFNDGTNPRWMIATDTFQEGMPATDPGLVPPGGLLQPERGFGLLWRNTPTVRDRLGWALAIETGYTVTIQYDAITGTRYLTTPAGTVYGLLPGGQNWSVAG